MRVMKYPDNTVVREQKYVNSSAAGEGSYVTGQKRQTEKLEAFNQTRGDMSCGGWTSREYVLFSQAGTSLLAAGVSPASCRLLP